MNCLFSQLLLVALWCGSSYGAFGSDLIPTSDDYSLKRYNFYESNGRYRREPQGKTTQADSTEPFPTVPPFDNKTDCPLFSLTMFPWIVRVYDEEKQTTAGHGSLITYKAVLTNARNYPPKTPGKPLDVSKYSMIGQTIWNLSNPFDPCSQTRGVWAHTKHPKFLGANETFFDFAIWILNRNFNISGPSYPVMFIPNSAAELFSGIQFINVMNTSRGCGLPYFSDRKQRMPVFSAESEMHSILYKTLCVDYMCELRPPDQDFTKMCVKRFKERANGTMLCMQSFNETVIGKVSSDPLDNWYAGTPLVCNGTTYGIASQIKFRQGFSTFPQDFHVILTFLRPWIWLMDQLRENSAPFTPFYIEALSLSSEHFTEPSRETWTYGPRVPFGSSIALNPSVVFLGIIMMLQCRIHFYLTS